MAVVGVAGEAPGAHHQALFVGDGKTDLDAKFVGLSGLAFADAFDFWGVQRVEFFLVFRALGADTLGALQPGVQRIHAHGVVRRRQGLCVCAGLRE